MALDVLSLEPDAVREGYFRVLRRQKADGWPQDEREAAVRAC